MPSLICRGSGGLQERERGHLAQTERGHLQDHRRQVGAQDLRVGERRPGLEVLLGVQPDADAVREPAAAALALLAEACEIGSIGSRCTLVR
jgi:hypothetical protein